MAELLVSEIVPQKPLASALIHASGEVLHQKGETLYPKQFELLEKCKIDSLYTKEDDLSKEDFSASLKIKSLQVGNLKPDDTFESDLKGADGEVLLKAGEKITTELIEELKGKSIDKLLTDRSASELSPDSAKIYRQMSMEFMAEMLETTVEDLELHPDLLIKNLDKELDQEGIDKALEGQKTDVKPEGEALTESLKNVGFDIKRTDTFKKAFLMVHMDIIDQTKLLFTQLSSKVEIQGKQITENCKRIVQQIIEDKNLLLNLTNVRDDDDYLVTHSLNIAILASNAATAMRFSQKQVLELAHGAFLADIGMLKVPKAITDKKTPLNMSEKLEIQRHVIHGADIVRKMNGLPISVLAAINQSHERIDGSGYPDGKKEEDIHTFAKIIAVCDTYDSGVSARPFRTKSHPHHVLKFLQKSIETSFAEDAVTGLIEFLGLYPVGSWLRLDNGRICKTTGCHPDKPDKPYIFLLPSKEFPEESKQDLSEDGTPEIKDLLTAPGGAMDVLKGF